MITILEVINITMKYTNDFILNCVELNRSGKTIAELTKMFVIKGETLTKRFRKLGYSVIDHRIRQLPQDELIQLYTNGMSVKQLAEKFGVDRGCITRNLIKQGIKPRNRSESMFNRMAFTSEEERKRLVQRANEAVRNRPAKRERLQKGSVTRSINRTKNLVGFGEDLLNSALIDLGFSVVSQYSFDIYSVDLLVNGNIAVEIVLGKGNPFLAKKNRIKTIELLNSGFGVIWVTATSKESFIANFSDVVTYIKAACLNPSFIGQYRVVRCKFETAHARDERNRFTSELAFKNPVMQEWACNLHITS